MVLEPHMETGLTILMCVVLICDVIWKTAQCVYHLKDRILFVGLVCFVLLNVPVM